MKTLIIHCITPFLITALTCCHGETKKENKSDDVTYATIRAEEGQPTTTMVLPGELLGYYETGIYPKVNSYVKSLLVDIGDKVRKGQILAELEAPELSSKLNEGFSKYKAAEAIYLTSKGKLIRLLQANKTAGAVSPFDLDLAKTNTLSDSLNLVAANANYQALQELVAYLKIVSPFDGIITERNISPGAFVGPSEKNVQAILVVKNEAKLRLRISVPEKHAAAIHISESISFSVSGYPDKKFSGKVSRCASNIDPMLRAETIEIEFDNKDQLLLPGMFAQVEMPLTRNEKTILVPESSIATNMERCFVIKLENNKAVLVDVRKGNSLNGKVEIFGNVSSGDLLLKEASEEIKNGTFIHSKT